ncbi:MAG: DNA-binding protein [Candidatus Altiarchaeales archaeon]|nr:MAG: DNA-binding protein [Candidatus Altiarchaeales archaeon]
MSDIEELRKRRIQQILYEQQRRQLEKQLEQQQQLEQQEAQINALIKKIITQILTPEARERLANIRLVRPQYAREIEIVLIQLYQQGRLPRKLSDEELKDMLKNISQRKKEIKIKRQ